MIGGLRIQEAPAQRLLVNELNTFALISGEPSDVLSLQNYILTWPKLNQNQHVSKSLPTETRRLGRTWLINKEAGGQINQ